ncbi:Hsp20/alpha crystallin family protein [Plantibacter sp. PA-3-X8]|jgi:HSP20 family protein|uniref:Heat shock protein Hsp20 n=3 Tax=Plantibacter TaxID=190323 RepID=A0A1S7B5E2_9MICO|nr:MULTISPECIES: Hsp20/alpha crystallin family protein [Plantibacter]AQX78916.1 heat-shock protein Hsp20 [Plantibacter flavus]AZH82432.1 Hsp20/alpha crystallin family protein [Plantibacter sp. PA-3-X8]MBD8101349.1 Hsp20/alpha crystallin family protein [Plantibacter sp. CFBP 8775]MBD8465172.1 Hsp20/alpha crystallin family protein [Plantibacter sp. CFBP 8798]MBD8536727.1 Hsp20/alpha crystallin family protein [Plantibacter sp. CFBP 13570]
MAMTLDPISQLDRFAASVLDSVRAPRPMPVDLFRDGDRYMMVADLPGIDPGSIDVDVDGGQLTIRAQRTADSREGVRWLARERGGGHFLRQFTLGEGVDLDGITASYDSGVLSVIIPVSERAKPRKITVDSTTDHPQSINA